MRIRWASSSEYSNQPPSRASTKDDRKGAKHNRKLTRTRSKHESQLVREAIYMAKKKHHLRQQNKVNRLAWSFVYVGNIESSITEKHLEALFSPCGTITRIQFRCSQGQAITIGRPAAVNICSPRDRQYATVEFKDPISVGPALELNDKWLGKSRLVVSVSPADLPEVGHIVNARLHDHLLRQGKPIPLRQKGLRPIPVQPTEIVIDGHSRSYKANRHHIFGFSFAKCVA